MKRFFRIWGLHSLSFYYMLILMISAIWVDDNQIFIFKCQGSVFQSPLLHLCQDWYFVFCLQMWSQEQGWSRWDLCDGFFLEAGKQNPFTRAALNDCRVSCEKQCFFWTLSCLMKQNRGEAFQILFFKSSAGSSYNKSFSTPISTRILLLSFLPSLGTDQTFNKTKIYVTKGQW